MLLQGGHHPGDLGDASYVIRPFSNVVLEEVTEMELEVSPHDVLVPLRLAERGPFECICPEGFLSSVHPVVVVILHLLSE